MIFRTVTLERSKVNESKRTAEVVFASETPIPTWRGAEVLKCNPQNARLERLNSGGALLREHDRAQQIGVVERAWIQGGKCRALVRFSKSPLAEQEWQDVLDGIRAQVSVGYIVHKYEVSERKETYTATDWEPLEISLVSVPADTACGVGRSQTQTSTNLAIEPMSTTTSAPGTKPNKRELERIQALEFFKRRYPDNDTQFDRIFDAGGGNDEMTDFARENGLHTGSRGNKGPRPLLTSGGDFNPGTERRTIGALIMEQRDVLETIARGGRKNIGFELPGVSSFRTIAARAALLTSDIGGTVQHTGAPVFGMERLTVADLLAPGITGAGTVRYPQEQGFTPSATTVAEGAAKPEQAFDLEPVDAGAKKIAAWCKISDELLQDSPAATDYINARLGFAVLRAEEDQILNGDGTGSNMLGLLNHTGLQSQALGDDSPTDAIRKAIGRIDTNTDFVASGIILSPLDWQTIELMKDANGRYIVGQVTTVNELGQTIRAKALWGLPVVVSKSIAQGTGLVGAFRVASQLFRRIGLLIEMTNSNEDDFKRNLVMIRAELRAALACYAPAAFCEVTGL